MSRRSSPPRRPLRKSAHFPQSIDRLHIERRLYQEGIRLVAGVDEVGRGCLAGPVFAGAVILPNSCLIPDINDSKQLSALQRDRLFDVIRAQALAWAVASVEAPEIDRINIHHASLKAMSLAVSQLIERPDYLLIDGRFTIKEASFRMPQEAVIRGDSLSQSIAAASILAKVTRDRWIAEEGKKYKDFSFAKHKGYGTAQHRLEIKKFGLTPLHRRSFRCG